MESGSRPRVPTSSAGTYTTNAKMFFYTGANPRNKTGVSWKVWQIARQGREVTAWWGSATLAKRQPVPTGKLRSKTWAFATEKAAEDFEQLRIHGKVRKGYYPQHL